MTLDYCNTIRDRLARAGTSVFLDFADVTRFSPDALLLIRAITGSRARQTTVRGNLPTDPSVATEFKATGFFDGFAKPPDDLPDAAGLMRKRSHTTVHSNVAAELVDFALEHTSMARPRAEACYRNLVELMTNTHDHARRSQRRDIRRRSWFASVYCRNGGAHFNFLDLGIGILTSTPARGFLQKRKTTLSGFGRTTLLREIFQGSIRSAAGLPGRGRGLRRMRQDAEEGDLADLEVLTSNVVGTVHDLQLRLTSCELRGTAFRWSMSDENGGNDG